jgi:3-oxoadipate enol-lactonase
MQSKKFLSFLFILLVGLVSSQARAQGNRQASYEEGGERWTNKRQPPEKVMEADEAGLELVRIENFLEKDNIFILEVKTLIEKHPGPISSQNKVKSGYVDVGKAKLYYEEQGQGTPLIMIHGGGLDRRNWDDQFEVMANRYRVVRYDARNHGLSQAEPETFSHYEDLFRLMESLEISKAVIMGLSMGGYIAIDFALVHPDKVIALIPVSPGLTGYEFKDKKFLENSKKINEAKDLDEAVEYILRSWMDGPRRSPAQVDPVVRGKARQMYKETYEDWRPGSREQRSDPSAIGRLSEIHAPTLVIVGDLDMPGILEIAGMIEKDIPGAKKVLIRGATHLLNMEKPQEFNRTVLDFLSTIAAPSTNQGRPIIPDPSKIVKMKRICCN